MDEHGAGNAVSSEAPRGAVVEHAIPKYVPSPDTCHNNAYRIFDRFSDWAAPMLILTEVLNPVGGTVAIVGNQAVFTPTNGFIGRGSFYATVSDGFKSSTAKMIVDVLPPVAPSPTEEFFAALREVPVSNRTELQAYFNGNLTKGGVNYSPADGDHVLLADGAYTGARLEWENTKPFAKGIVIRARNLLGARFTNFTGETKALSGITIRDVPRLTVWGCEFDGCALELDACDRAAVLRNKFHRHEQSALKLRGPMSLVKIKFNEMTVAAFEADYFTGETVFAIPYGPDKRDRRCIAAVANDTQITRVEIAYNYMHHCPAKGGVGYSDSVCGFFSTGEAIGTATTSLKWYVHHNRFYRGWYGLGSTYYGVVKSKAVDIVFARNTWIDCRGGLDIRQGYHTCVFADYWDNLGEGSSINIWSGDTTTNRGDPDLVDYHVIVGLLVKRSEGGIRFIAGDTPLPAAPAPPVNEKYYAATGAHVIACTSNKYQLGQYKSAYPCQSNRFYKSTYTTSNNQGFGDGSPLPKNGSDILTGVPGKVIPGGALAVDTKVFDTIPANWYANTMLEELGLTNIPGIGGEPGPSEIPPPTGTSSDQVGPYAPWVAT